MLPDTLNKYAEDIQALRDDADRHADRATIAQSILAMSGSPGAVPRLAHRGEVWRVSRLDLAQRAVVELGVLAMEHFAREFDGVLWSVISKGALRVLDTQHNLTTVIWQVGDLPGDVLKFSTSADLEQMLIRTYRNELEIWRYRLPQRTLAGRDTVAELGEKERLVLTSHYNDLVIGLEQNAQGQTSFYYRYSGMANNFALSWFTGIPQQIHAFSNYILLMTETESDAMEGWMLKRGNAGFHSTVSWPNRQARSRLCGAHWLIFDDSGRLFHLNLEDGRKTCLSF